MLVRIWVNSRIVDLLVALFIVLFPVLGPAELTRHSLVFLELKRKRKTTKVTYITHVSKGLRFIKAKDFG